MRKRKLFLFVLAILILIALPWGIGRLVNANQGPLSGYIIVLDAGHGGVDGGAVSQDGLVEKEINLAITRYLQDYLQQSGSLVYLTREGDYDLADEAEKSLNKRKRQDLSRRAQIVEDVDADLLVTIHLNAMKSGKWRGAQTFYYDGQDDSKKLAEHIQRQLIAHLQNTTRTVNKSGEIYLLRTSERPAVLVEAGFISNLEEAQLLKESGYQKKIAFAIYEGIIAYLTEPPEGELEDATPTSEHQGS